MALALMGFCRRPTCNVPRPQRGGLCVPFLVRIEALPLGKIGRRNDAFLPQPLVHAQFLADVATLGLEGPLLQPFFELGLPPKGKVGWTRDEDAFNNTAKFELTDDESCHAPLGDHGVIGQQKVNSANVLQAS